MAFTLVRAFEQWHLSANTSTTLFGGGTGSEVTVPFDTRYTGFPDLGNTISGGVVTLSAAVKANWTNCKVTAFCKQSGTDGNDDWFDMILRTNSRANYVAINVGTGWNNDAAHNPQMESPWFDHTGLTNLELTWRGEDLNWGAVKDQGGVNSYISSYLQLEFR